MSVSKRFKLSYERLGDIFHVMVGLVDGSCVQTASAETLEARFRTNTWDSVIPEGPVPGKLSESVSIDP